MASAASSVEMTVFVAAVDAGNFSAAARFLGITPSAVSKQISRLEARLGARLLNRSTRRISLTDLGCEFYERSQSILSDIDAAERAVGDASDRPHGRLRIMASISFGQRQIVPLIPEFVSRFPDVRVDVLFSDRMINIVDEGIDIAVRVSAPTDSALIARRLVPDRRVICASPAYLREHGMPTEPEDLAARDLSGRARHKGRAPDGDPARLAGPAGKHHSRGLSQPTPCANLDPRVCRFSRRENDSGPALGRMTLGGVTLRSRFRIHRAVDESTVGRHVEFPVQPVGVHVADFPEHGPFGPGAVVQPEAPGDIGV